MPAYTRRHERGANGRARSNLEGGMSSGASMPREEAVATSPARRLKREQES